MHSIASSDNFASSETQRRLNDADIAAADVIIISQHQENDSKRKDSSSSQEHTPDKKRLETLKKKRRKMGAKSDKQKRKLSTANSDKIQSIGQPRIVSEEDILPPKRQAIVENHVVIHIKAAYTAPIETQQSLSPSTERPNPKPGPDRNVRELPQQTNPNEKKSKSFPLWKAVTMVLCLPIWIIYLVIKCCKKNNNEEEEEEEDEETEDKKQVAFVCGCIVCLTGSLGCLPKLC